jgi:hypothetical protein
MLKQSKSRSKQSKVPLAEIPISSEPAITGPLGAALVAISGLGPTRTPDQLRDLLEQALLHMSPQEAEMLTGQPPDRLISFKDLLTLCLADNLAKRNRPQETHDARRLYRRLETLRSLSPRDWAVAKNNLALTELRCEDQDRPAALSRAAAAYRAALEVWTPQTDVENWVGATVGLSEVLRDPSIGDSAKRLNEAVSLLRDAINSDGDQIAVLLRAKLLGSLGSALMRRGARRNLADLDEAIECKRLAYALLDAKSHQKAKIYQRMDLGIALSRRTEMLGTGSQEARETLEATLADCDQFAEPEQWASVAGNYAIALKEAADATNVDVHRAIDLLKGAIRIQEQAGALWAWAGNQNNLANAILEASGDDPVATIDEAANAYEAALTVWTRKAHPLEWALTTARLANTNLKRASLTGRAELYQMALAGFDAALSILSPDRNPLDWVRIMNHRAGVLRDIAEKQSEPIDALQAALAAYDAAATIARNLSPKAWAQIRNNVGEAYSELAQWTKDPAHLAASAKAYQDALDARPREIDQIEWAQTSAALARILARVGLTKIAYEYALQTQHREAYQTEWSQISTPFADILAQCDPMDEALRRFREALEVAQRMGRVSDTQNIATGLGATLADVDDWSGAADAYEIAVDAAEEQYLAAVLRGSREIVMVGLSALATMAAYARALAGDAAAASTMIERARARLLGEALELDADALKRFIRDDPEYGPALLASAAELQQADSAAVHLMTEADQLEPNADRYRQRAEQALRQRRRDAKAAFDAAMAHLRKKADIQSWDNDPHLPVAYILVTRCGSLILLRTRNEVRAIPAPQFDSQMLEKLLVDESERPGPLSANARTSAIWGREERAALEAVLGRVMPAIGEALCAPLAAALQDLKAQAVGSGRLAVRAADDAILRTGLAHTKRGCASAGSRAVSRANMASRS